MLCTCANVENTNMTSMPRKNKTTGRFKPSFTCYNRSMSSPYTARVADHTSKEDREDPLAGYEAWPTGQRNKKDPYFVKMNETLRSTATECIDKFQYNYLSACSDGESTSQCQRESNPSGEYVFH